MASIAVLPVLLGLGVDYAIQYQARVHEEGAAGRAARVAVPVIATAALATGVGFLVLLLSPVPMVRGFGALLVVGIAIAFALALTAGTAALRWARRATAAGALAARRRRALGGRRGGAGAPLRARLAGRSAAVRRRCGGPGGCSRSALAVAAAGWAVDSRTEVVSDIDRLVPQDLQAVQDLKTLQRATGVAGEIDVVVEGDDLTDPAVVKWMRDYQAGVLERYGYSAERGCGRADLCPALSLPDLFRSSESAGDRERIRACSTRCRRTSRAP